MTWLLVAVKEILPIYHRCFFNIKTLLHFRLRFTPMQWILSHFIIRHYLIPITSFLYSIWAFIFSRPLSSIYLPSSLSLYPSFLHSFSFLSQPISLPVFSFSLLRSQLFQVEISNLLSFSFLCSASSFLISSLWTFPTCHSKTIFDLFAFNSLYIGQNFLVVLHWVHWCKWNHFIWHNRL